MKEFIVNISNLGLNFDTNTLFSDANLSISKGELVALFGSNGTGKSSLIKILTGNLRPTSGSITIDKQPIHNLSTEALSHYISVVFSTNISAPNMKVFDIVAIGRTPYLNWLGHLNNDDKQKIEEALKAVEISHLIDQDFETLSDGEKQRAMIAKALAQDTPILLLDEPTAHLDIKNRVLLLKLLRDIAKKYHKAILISSHELEITLKLADKVWLIENKSIHESSPEDLVLQGIIKNTFQSKNVLFDNEKGVFDITFETNHLIRLEGGNTAERFWYQIALKKLGYNITKDAKDTLTISSNGHWSFKNTKGKNIQSLIEHIKHTGTKFDKLK